MRYDEILIVAIGRNEGQRLVGCLESVISQNATVVYVDSGSTDGSCEKAKELGVPVVELDMTIPFTAARARNEGFKAAIALNSSAQFIQFIDGDCELDAAWLETSLPFMAAQKDVAISCGRRRERFPRRSIYNRLCDIEWNTPVGEAPACGGDSLVRVDAFKQVGGFRADLLAGEEPEMCMRMRQKGWKVWRLDAEMTRHDAAMTRFGQWWLRCVRSGFAEAEISSRQLSSGAEKGSALSVIFWAAALPLFIVIAVFFNAAAALAALLYPLQVIRIAVQRDVTVSESWIYGIFMMIAKFAQLQGAVKYHCRRPQKRTRAIEYK